MRKFLTRFLVRAVKRTPLSRGKARKITLGVIEKVHPDPVEGAFRGVPFLFHMDNTTERKALISDAYDNAELNFLLGFLDAHPATFVDIGANSGLYSLFLASRMPVGSRVIAAEPNPLMCQRIATNAGLLRQRGLGKGVVIDIEPSALGASEGQLYLNLSRGLGPAYLIDKKSENSIAVPVKTLSGLCREKGIKELQAIKIDVEGYEDRILLPFLSEAPPKLLPRALVFETAHCNAWQGDVIAACIRSGYRPSGKTRSSAMMTLCR